MSDHHERVEGLLMMNVCHVNLANYLFDNYKNKNTQKYLSQLMHMYETIHFGFYLFKEFTI